MAFRRTSTTYPCPAADGSSPRTQRFDAPPSFCLTDGASYEALMETSEGSMRFELFAASAPTTVNNFVFLARYHYFDGIGFHRIIPGFVVQGGDPTGSGAGGPGYRFRDELPAAGAYRVGSLAMANAGPNTNGSQFFIVSGPSGEQLPPSYSLFGQLIEGEDTLARLDALGTSQGRPLRIPTIERVEITER
jgi:peptidylprolyl isomerase